MNCKINIVIVILLLITIFSCKKDLSPISVTIPQFYYTQYETSNGIDMKLQFIEDSYTLDDEILACFTAINRSDTNSFHIISPHGPLAILYMYNQQNQLIDYSPRYRTNTYYDFYFNPGDTLKANLRWNQFTYSNDHFSDLKAYSGKYLVTLSHPGIPTAKIGKWITINEIGDPISTKLYYYLNYPDTLRLDFIIRNRISKRINFELLNNNPIEVEYYVDPSEEKIFSHFPQFDFSKIEIDAKNDKMIFSYKILNSDSMFQNLTGSYICKINIKCKTRTFAADSWIFL